MSSQKAQTGWTDFIVEHHDLDAVTARVGEVGNRGALLHHPPLVCLLVGAPVGLLQPERQGPEESQSLDVLRAV